MLQYLLVQLDLQLTTTGTDHVTISSRPARSPAHNHRDRSCYNIFSSSSISSSQPQGPIMLQYRLVQLDLQLTTTGTDHVTISSRPARSPAHNHRDRSCYNIVSSSSISLSSSSSAKQKSTHLTLCFCLFVLLNSVCPINNLSVMKGPGLNQY